MDLVATDHARHPHHDVVSGSLGEMYTPGACLARTTSDRPDRLRLHDAASADYTYTLYFSVVSRPLSPRDMY